MADLVPSGIAKVNRSQFLTYLDTTPSALSPTWSIVGVGITELAQSFNPQVDTEKWIIEDNSRTDHSSNQKQASVTQKIYKGDPCFEFINSGRDQLNYKSHILDIDRWNGNGSSYPAKYNDVIITVTSYMGENAQIEYDIYYDGDPVEGTVTFAGNVPTFIPTTSL